MITLSALTVAEPVPLDPVQRVVLRDAVIEAARKYVAGTGPWGRLVFALDALDAAEGRK